MTTSNQRDIHGCPYCVCGHSETSHGSPMSGRTADINIGLRGGMYPCRKCDCHGYFTTPEM